MNDTLIPTDNIIVNGNNGGGGNYYAYLYGSTLGQDVFVGTSFVMPQGVNTLTLQYDSMFRTIGSCAYGENTSDVFITDDTTGEVVELIDLYNANTAANEVAYSTHSVSLGSDLIDRAGHTMKIFFSPYNEDVNCEQVLFLDNISLNASTDIPVYRMANWKTQERLFTTDFNEVLAIKDRNGWVHEGTAFYVR